MNICQGHITQSGSSRCMTSGTLPRIWLLVYFRKPWKHAHVTNTGLFKLKYVISYFNSMLSISYTWLIRTNSVHDDKFMNICIISKTHTWSFQTLHLLWRHCHMFHFAPTIAPYPDSDYKCLTIPLYEYTPRFLMVKVNLNQTRMVGVLSYNISCPIYLAL